MWNGKTVAVVVPAFGEERRIGRVVARMPAWVDAIVVVDDASRDGTAKAATASGDPRVQVLRHDVNRGVGAAIVTGYRHGSAHGADILAVMAGDDQMDPADLARVVDPVATDRADYVKGNRFMHPLVRDMPLARRAAGRVLAALTRATTGLAIDDSQCGYTALSRAAEGKLPLEDLWPRYGYPNDLLVLVARAGLRVAEVPVRPVYAGEASGVRAWHALSIARLLLRRFRQRPGAYPSSCPGGALRNIHIWVANATRRLSSSHTCTSAAP
jgi:glycosyltransferase involved in cell wall biosynthesis